MNKEKVNIEDIMKDIMKLRKKLMIVNQCVFELEQRVSQMIPLKKKKK